MNSHYTPAAEGFRIVGSSEQFNRALYGGHSQDRSPEKYFTAAGDTPIVMGAISDWRKREDCSHAKCGTFMAGIAVTPGYHLPIFYYYGEKDGDRTAEWFHQSPGTVATFRCGWMEYEVKPFFQCYPVVDARIKVLPLQSCDGFLVSLSVHTDQRENLVLAFGGVTDFLGSLMDPYVEARHFRPEDCRGNEVLLTGEGTAEVRGSPGDGIRSTVRIGASFPVELSIGDARSIIRPGLFAAPVESPVELPMVRMTCAVDAGECLEGFVVVVRNAPAGTLESWVARDDPVGELEREIREKSRALVIRTPDPYLDLTAAPNVIAMDACWHDNAFCHGAFSWHCPYMGWRNWYGPTVLGWRERVQAAFRTHASFQLKPEETSGPEEVVYEGPGAYAKLKNSYGYIPEIPDGRRGIFYNMQEVGVDMALHGIEWSGDLAYAAEVFQPIADVLAWEERILDPDGDGLYQNWLNTWISDAHSYNGGGCAQSSAYNYRANRLMAVIAKKIGRDAAPFERRADRIADACRRLLWQPDRGVMAEYVDTVGNKLVHPSPELATIYHSIEADLVDAFQAYQMLRFTETDLRNARTLSRGGRLVWSSNWYPQLYSSCGLYAAENLHLAWAYFQCGQEERANDILRAVTDAHYLGRSPGLVAHCMTESGYSGGSADFSEISSLHLRTIVEGLFGVRANLLEDTLRFSPCFPPEWDHASLVTGQVSLRYERRGATESFAVRSTRRARLVLRVRLRAANVEEVLLDGRPAPWRVEPGIGSSACVLETEGTEATVSVVHGSGAAPTLEYPARVRPGDGVTVAVQNGTATELKDPTSLFDECRLVADRVHGTARGRPGGHVVFIRARSGQWDGWLPADLQLEDSCRRGAPRAAPERQPEWAPVELEGTFNMSLSAIHAQEYREPRPKGYSIMCRLDGRFGWDWNQMGFGKVDVDESALRGCGGLYRVRSGVPFRTPSAGKNVACVSVWRNYPEELRIPLEGRAREVAVLFIGVTNPMQSRVENARLAVGYRGGGAEEVSLVNPENLDDWLVASVQRANETVYFSDHNHAIVERILVDPARELDSLLVRAVANEVIVGVLGVTLGR